MPWKVFLLLSESSWISNPLPAGGAEEDHLWVKTLGPPAQFLLLCPEDPLLQSLVESPQELASGQHTITNSLDKEERRRHWALRVVSHNQRYMAYINNSIMSWQCKHVGKGSTNTIAGNMMYNRMKIFRKLQCKGSLPRRRGKGQSLIFHDKSDQPPETASMTVAKVVATMKLRSKNETTTINTIYTMTVFKRSSTNPAYTTL